MEDNTEMFAQIIAQGEAVKGKDTLARLRKLAQSDVITNIEEPNNGK